MSEEKMSHEKITLVMSRSDFVSNNRNHMDVEIGLSVDGYVDLTEVAQNFNYLNAYEIKNWDEIKHTIDKDCIDICDIADGDIDSDDCEVSFDWNKYEIIWEK